MNVVAVALVGWALIEYYLRWRSRSAKKSLDWTFLVVAATIGPALVLGFRADQNDSATIVGGWVPVVVGLCVLIGGVALRTWAIVELGRFFTVTVTIQPDHRVIDTGPYRVIRHPSYTGLLLIFVGAGIALDNWISLLVLATLPLIGLLVRIYVEEATLERALGDSYTRYEARTKRLIPGVW